MQGDVEEAGQAGAAGFQLGQRHGLPHAGEGEITTPLQLEGQPPPWIQALTDVHLHRLNIVKGEIHLNPLAEAPTTHRQAPAVLVEAVLAGSYIQNNADPEIYRQEAAGNAVETHHQTLGHKEKLGRMAGGQEVQAPIAGRTGQKKADAPKTGDQGNRNIGVAAGSLDGLEDLPIGVGSGLNGHGGVGAWSQMHGSPG